MFHRKNHSYVDNWDQLDEPPYIIPPIINKNPPAEELFRKIWYEAFNSLCEAEKIYLIGYSMPPDDLQARTLLRSGILASGKNYKVIDPDPNVGTRYFKSVSSDLDFIQGQFNKKTLNKMLEE